MKEYSQNHPHIFSLLIIFIAVLSGIIVQLPTIPFSFREETDVIIEGIGRGLMILPFLYLLSRFGWMKEAGFQPPKEKKVWIWVALGIFVALSPLNLLFKNLSIDFSDMLLVFSIIVSTFGSVIYEETIYRGVIQTTFYQKWLGSPKGLFKVAIVSALYFGLSHLIGLVSGANPILTITLSIYTIGLGIFLSALLVYSKSIWPAIVTHWLINCISGLISIGKTTDTNTLFLSLVLAVPILPITAGGLWLLWRMIQNQGKMYKTEAE